MNKESKKVEEIEVILENQSEELVLDDAEGQAMAHNAGCSNCS